METNDENAICTSKATSAESILDNLLSREGADELFENLMPILLKSLSKQKSHFMRNRLFGFCNNIDNFLSEIKEYESNNFVPEV